MHLLLAFPDDILASAWTHDVIEDCRQTYNDVNKVCGKGVAEITYALSNEKGKTRKERANDVYYKGIRNTYGATFIKICDRIANVKYSRDNNSPMLDVYRKEQSNFKDQLFTEDYSVMWSHLEELLS